MSYEFWEGIAGTPWWVYVMFVYLMYLAYLATKPRIIFLKSTIVVQSISVGLLLVAVFYLADISLRNILIWMGTMLAGAVGGWLQFRFSKIKAIKNKSQIYMPGSWGLFLLVIILVGVKYYYLGHEYVINIDVLKQEKFITFFLILSGLFVGLFIGRTHYLLHCAKFGPFLER